MFRSMSAPGSDEFHVASQAILFEDGKPSCDICGELMDTAENDEGYAIPGRGLYVWARADGVHYEKPPLCASCGTGIGVMVFAQSDIEEEEG